MKTIAEYLTPQKERNENLNSKNRNLLKVTPSDAGAPRKTLQTLQLTSDNQSLTRPTDSAKKVLKSKGKSDVFVDKISPVTLDKVEIFCDDKESDLESKEAKSVLNSSNGSSHCACSCHKEDEEKDKIEKLDEAEALQLMCSEKVPEGYWKALAEKRAEALNESLTENEELHNKVAEQEEKIDELSKLAKDADYFAGMLRQMIEGKDYVDSIDSDEDTKTDNT